MNLEVPYYRVAAYIFVAYFVGFYLGSLTKKEIECVSVDKKVYCGKIIKHVEGN